MSFRLLILRHGPAGERETFKAKTGKPDSLRPLTSDGKKEVRLVARYLKRTHKNLDVIFTSPYTRAAQTAEILAKKFPKTRVFVMKDLKPHVSPQATLKALDDVGSANDVAIVGHEPHLSKFLSYVLTGGDEADFDLKKTGFAVLEFATTLEAKRARMKCLVQPNQVKKFLKDR